jgi:hypothetical protein
MRLYHLLVTATALHQRRTQTCSEGDCYGFLKLLLRNITVTGLSKYNNLMALSDVKFESDMSISDLSTALQAVQTKANRLKPGSIDDEVMKGALLSLARRQSKFEHLATDFAKKSSAAMTFDEIMDEFITLEANLDLPSKPSSASRHGQQLANQLSGAHQANSMGELAALFTRALSAAQAAPSSTQRPQQHRREACRNFQAGRCKRTAADCRFEHVGSSTPAVGQANPERKKFTWPIYT